MGRFAISVDTSEAREAFKAKYNIPIGVTITHYKLGEWYTVTNRGGGYPHDCLHRRRDEDPHG